MIRKILTQEEKQKRETRNKTIISVILGLILLLSSVGYAFFSFEREDTKTENLIYKNLEFIQTAYGFWFFSYGGNDYQTLYNPEQTSNITGTITSNIQDFYNKPLYFGVDSKEELITSGNSEILRNLQKIISKSQPSCLSPKCIEDYPLKNCSSNNIILFKKSPSNSSFITQEDSCITLTYSLGDEEKIADALLYKILGIQ